MRRQELRAFRAPKFTYLQLRFCYFNRAVNKPQKLPKSVQSFLNIFNEGPSVFAKTKEFQKIQRQICHEHLLLLFLSGRSTQTNSFIKFRLFYCFLQKHPYQLLWSPYWHVAIWLYFGHMLITYFYFFLLLKFCCTPLEICSKSWVRLFIVMVIC